MTGQGGLLLVHAHPDDETLTTGATMARYAAAGVPVTLVTCTLGQCGEVLVPELAHLSPDELGEHRRTEFALAMRELGVHDHRLLADGRWRDSGMVWVRPGIAGVGPDADPRAFALADVDEAAAALAEVLVQTQPRAVVSYDPGGGYGHPDHVQAHRVTTRAVELAGTRAGWPRLYWVRTPKSWVLAERTRLLAERPPSMSARALADPMPPVVADDHTVTTVVDAGEYLERKAAALRAHATQVRVEADCFALSDGVAQLLRGREGFQLVRGPLGPPGRAGYEDDLLGLQR